MAEIRRILGRSIVFQLQMVYNSICIGVLFDTAFEAEYKRHHKKILALLANFKITFEVCEQESGIWFAPCQAYSLVRRAQSSYMEVPMAEQFGRT